MSKRRIAEPTFEVRPPRHGICLTRSGSAAGTFAPARARTAARSLVERFDIEPYSDFSAKWSNFRGLVLFCIDAKFCNKIFVGKLLTRSTRFTCFCTAQTSIFQQNFVKLFRIFRQNFAKFDHFHWILLRFWWKFLGISPNICRKCWTFLKFLDFWWILAKSHLAERIFYSNSDLKSSNG